MVILGIETSCDETGAALIEGTTKKHPVRLLSNVVASSLAKHAVTGGVIPEIAAREQIKYILPVIKQALHEGLGTFKGAPAIDAVAVTYGPGLIGSLLVGVETAKSLAMLWNIPIIPVNHMYGHIYANWIAENDMENMELYNTFPAVALVVSGGHTDIVLLEDHGQLRVLGGTRDDAAGEAFDKIGRLLGLPYPAGPVISRLAEVGNPKAFHLPRPMWDSKDYDFSFSGLKTSVLNLVRQHQWDFSKQPIGDEQLIADLCASVQKAIVDVLVFKTMQVLKEYKVTTLLLAGGVAANKQLINQFREKIDQEAGHVVFKVPKPVLCTDNGAMIAAAGFYNDDKTHWENVTANPELYY